MTIGASALNPGWLAVAGAVGMATMGVMARYAEIDAGVITFYRLGLGAAFVAALLLWRQPRWQMPRALTLVGGVFLAAFIVFYVKAMNFTTMANAVLTVYLAPLLAAVAAHVIWRERINRWQFLCICFALFGFALVMQLRLSLSGQDMTGLGYAGLALLAYAGFMLLNRHNTDTIPATQAALWQMLVGAAVILAVIGPAALAVPADAVPWVLATGLIPGFLAIVFTVTAMQRLPTAVFGTLAFTEPVAVVIFGWILFGERLALLQVTGCVVIVSAGIAQARIGAGRLIQARLAAATG